MLLTSEQSGEIAIQPSEVLDSIEALRRIITRQEQREVGYEDAREIGSSLIQFFQVLAEANDEPEA